MTQTEFKDRSLFAKWYMETVLDVVKNHHFDAFIDIATMFERVRNISMPGHTIKKFTIFFRPTGTDIYIDGARNAGTKQMYLDNNDIAYDVEWVYGVAGYESIYVTQIKTWQH